MKITLPTESDLDRLLARPPWMFTRRRVDQVAEAGEGPPLASGGSGWMRARRTILIPTAAAGVALGVVAAWRKTQAPPPKVRSGTFANGIEYLATGDGPQNVLVFPGGPGTPRFAGIWSRVGSGMFRPLAEAGYTVWRLTRRRGMPPGHTVADMADDVARVIADAFGGHVDAVVGISFGGTIALQLAARHPGVVGRVALVASSATISERAKESTRRYGEALGHGRFTEAARASLDDLPPGRSTRWVWRLLAALLGRVLAASGFNLPDVLVETQAAIDVDARPDLHQIAAPVLIIVGDKDIAFTRDIVEETTRLIPDCTLIRYEGLREEGTLWDKRVPRDLLTFVNRDR